MKNALLQDILETPLYAEYYASLAMTPLPHSMDSIWPVMGCSDFDILEKLCMQALYTCYMRGDTLHFEPRYTASKEMMELDAAQEVQQVELLYTIQDLIGTLTVATCDGYEEKKVVQESVTLSSLPYTKKLSGILKHTSTSVVDDGCHEIEELNCMVAGMKMEVEHRDAKVNGVCFCRGCNAVMNWYFQNAEMVNKRKSMKRTCCTTLTIQVPTVNGKLS